MLNRRTFFGLCGSLIAGLFGIKVAKVQDPDRRIVGWLTDWGPGKGWIYFEKGQHLDACQAAVDRRRFYGIDAKVYPVVTSPDVQLRDDGVVKGWILKDVGRSEGYYFRKDQLYAPLGTMLRGWRAACYYKKQCGYGAKLYPVMG